MPPPRAPGPRPLLLLLLLWPLPPPLVLASAPRAPEEEAPPEAPPGLDLPPRGAPPRREEAAFRTGSQTALRLPGPLLLLLLPPAREGRSAPAPAPRRCVRLQESCLGPRLPCCDPCAACYCRFFNANCFCRRFGAPGGEREPSSPCGSAWPRPRAPAPPAQ